MNLTIMIVFIVIGLGLILKGFIQLKRNKNLVHRGIIIKGEVLKIDKTLNNKYYAIVGYEDENSKTKYFNISRSKTMFSKFKRNDKVEVIVFENEDTHIIEINNNYQLYYEPLSIIFTGFLVIVCFAVLDFINII